MEEEWITDEEFANAKLELQLFAMGLGKKLGHYDMAIWAIQQFNQQKHKKS